MMTDTELFGTMAVISFVIGYVIGWVIGTYRQEDK